MPTAVFYNAEDNSRAYGRAAMAAYVDGHEGRLMRSIKSILGSDLMDEATELPNGMQVRYLDVVVAYLRYLKQQAEGSTARPAAALVRTVLANHGVHIAGTDFDRTLNLATIMPVLGYGGVGPGNRPVPSKEYFDLATWHLINTNYAPKRMAELRLMRPMYEDHLAHARLMRVLQQHLGHELSTRAEQAKIAVAERSAAEISLDFIDPALAVRLTEAEQTAALADDVERIVEAARETLKTRWY